jgi:hypothetical protein
VSRGKHTANLSEQQQQQQEKEEGEEKLGSGLAGRTPVAGCTLEALNGVSLVVAAGDSASRNSHGTLFGCLAVWATIGE